MLNKQSQKNFQPLRTLKADATEGVEEKRKPESNSRTDGQKEPQLTRNGLKEMVIPKGTEIVNRFNKYVKI
jgi:hypothetical protein